MIGREDAGRGHQQRVAIGRGLGDDVGADIAAGAGAILDDHRLAQRLGNSIGDDARASTSARPPAGNGAIRSDRTIGISLRLRWCARQKDNADAERKRAASCTFDAAIGAPR